MGPGQIQLHAGNGKFLEADPGRRLMELAILVTARELDQQVEWTLHELEARKQGLEPAIIDVVRYRKPAKGLSEKETVIIQLGREIFGKHHVTSETYVQAVNLFGERDALDLAALMGQHSTTAGILTAFNQQLPLDKSRCCLSANAVSVPNPGPKITVVLRGHRRRRDHHVTARLEAEDASRTRLQGWPLVGAILGMSRASKRRPVVLHAGSQLRLLFRARAQWFFSVQKPNLRSVHGSQFKAGGVWDSRAAWVVQLVGEGLRDLRERPAEFH